MNIAVLGLGFMGSTHLKALRKMRGVRLAAVASNDDRQLTGDLSGIQGNIGGPGEKMDFSGVACYRDPMEAVQDPAVEAVDICLPTNQHAAVALAALRAGKHVLVEKPMALDGASADAIVEEAARSGRILMAAQVVRFMPWYRAAADMVRGGKLGRVRGAFFRRRCAAPAWSQWLGDPAQSGGGIFDLLIHDVDFCVQLFGVPQGVAARGYEDLPGGIDWISAELDYGEGGPVVTVTGGWNLAGAFPFSMEYSMVADGGALDYSSAGRPVTLYRADRTSEVVAVPEVDGYEAEIEYFVDCVTQGRQPEFCPPRESAAAVRVARLMTESRSRNGERAPCRF